MYQILDEKGRREITIDLEYDRVYGLGERFDALNLKGRHITCKVIERFCNQGQYTYMPMPFFITDKGWGVFVDTDEVTDFYFEEKVRISLPENAVVYMLKGSIREMIKDHIELTGPMEIPPKYAFGPWISANHWSSRRDVDEVVEKLESNSFARSIREKNWGLPWTVTGSSIGLF